MVDHEGLVKEIVWEADGVGGDMVFHPEVHAYTPECAPERLLHHPTTCPLLQLLEASLFAALVGALLVGLVLQVYLRLRPMPDTPAAAPPGTRLVLVDFPPVLLADGLRPTCSISPFTTKVEAFLRFNALEFRKKIPYIERGDLLIADSASILLHLELNGDVQQEAALPCSAREASAAVALARLAENDISAAVYWYRWMDEQNWARNRHILLSAYGLPRVVETVLLCIMRKRVWKRLWEHGFARQSEAEQLGLIRSWLQAVDGQLGAQQAYCCGSQPYAVDASVFGALDQCACAALNPQLAALLHEFPALCAYHQRIKDRFFAQPAVWVEQGGSTSSRAAETHAAQDSPALNSKED